MPKNYKHYVSFGKGKKLILRDGLNCRYCGKVVSILHISLDHVIPNTKGGSNNWKNLVISCRACNHEKNLQIMTPKHPQVLSDEEVESIVNNGWVVPQEIYRKYQAHFNSLDIYDGEKAC